jgi:hypothetical protein
MEEEDAALTRCRKVRMLVSRVAAAEPWYRSVVGETGQQSVASPPVGLSDDVWARRVNEGSCADQAEWMHGRGAGQAAVD